MRYVTHYSKNMGAEFLLKWPRLSKVFGGRAATWLTQQVHYELSQVRADRIKLKRPEFA